MRRFAVLSLFPVLVLAGCAGFGYVEDKVIDGVDRYCAKVSEEDRAAIRNKVNAVLTEKGHAVKVWCAGDDYPARMGRAPSD